MSSPDDYLKLLEGMNQMTDMMDTFKTGLEQKGWSTTAAEQASIVVVGPALALAMQAAAGRPRPPAS